MTADCAKTAARLSVYLDGGLNAIERDDMNRHFSACPACRAELETQRQAEAALTAARLALPSVGDLRPDFYSRLQSENAARAKRAASQWKLAVPALAAAVAAVLWRPSADVPTKRSASALPPAAHHDARIAPGSNTEIAAQNFTNAKPITELTRRRMSPALSELKTPPRASRPSLLRIADLSSVAKKTPTMLAPSSPQFQQETRKWALASAAAKTTFGEDAPRRVALAEENERLTAFYGARLYSDAESQVKLQRNESFYFAALTPSSAAHGEEAKRDDFALKFDTALADRTTNLPTPFADGIAARESSALALSDAASMPAMISALAAPGGPASAEAPAAVQIAAGALFGMERAKTEATALDGADFEVQDEERGFVSRIKVTDSLEERQDGETLTIEAEADNGS